MSLGYHNIQYTAQSGLAERYSEEIRARFWAKVNKHGPAPLAQPWLGPCWIWTANRVGRGKMHGQFTYRLDGAPQQVHVYAHRFAWELAHGPIPEGLNCLHKCDVGACVRDEHLFIGTQGDNLKDASQKGRLTTSRNTRAFTLADRLAIYDMPYERGLIVRLAHECGVSKAAISHIRSGRFVGCPLSALRAPRSQERA